MEIMEINRKCGHDVKISTYRHFEDFLIYHTNRGIDFTRHIKFF